jgi:hypothetical protein
MKFLLTSAHFHLLGRTSQKSKAKIVITNLAFFTCLGSGSLRYEVQMSSFTFMINESISNGLVIIAIPSRKNPDEATAVSA